MFVSNKQFNHQLSQLPESFMGNNSQSVLVTLHAHGLTREFVQYLTKKLTVLRVIIKVTKKLFTHYGVFYVITRSLLKHTDLNITEFLTESVLFIENCAS